MNVFYPKAINTKIRRAVVLMGPRRVGKTWMLHHTIDRMLEEKVSLPKHILYASMEHSAFNDVTVDQLLEYYSELKEIDVYIEKCFIIIDEIQYLNDWERHIVPLVNHQPNLKIIVSGSAAAALKRKSAESGAGRLTDFILPPLSFYEFLEMRHPTKNNELWIDHSTIEETNREFIDYINFGGFPEAVTNEEVRENIQVSLGDDVVGKVLQKDLPSIYGISDIQELNNIFTVLAYNTGDEISYDEISQKTSVSKTTIKKYIEYLESAFLIRIIDRVDISAKRFKRRNRFKVYLTNPSMRSAIFGPVKADDKAMPHLVETAIFAQYFHDDTTGLRYGRGDKGKWEVDLIALDPDLSVGMVTEIKWSDRTPDHPEELRGLIKFCHKNNIKEAWVTTKSIVYDLIIINSVTIWSILSIDLAWIIGKLIMEQKEKDLKDELSKLMKK